MREPRNKFLIAFALLALVALLAGPALARAFSEATDRRDLLRLLARASTKKSK